VLAKEVLPGGWGTLGESHLVGSTVGLISEKVQQFTRKDQIQRSNGPTVEVTRINKSCIYIADIILVQE